MGYKDFLKYVLNLKMYIKKIKITHNAITLVVIAMHNYIYLDYTEHTVSCEYLSRSLVFNNIIMMCVCVRTCMYTSVFKNFMMELPW